MKTGFILIYLTFVTLKSVYGDYGFFGGWTPIPNEEFYRRFNISIIKPDNMQRIDPSWYQNIDITTENIDAIKYEAIKLVEPQKLLGKFTIKRFGLSTYKINNTNEVTNYTKIETSTAKNARKAKKINERNYVVASKNNLITKEEETLDSTEDYGDFSEEAVTEENYIESYAVTERSVATNFVPRQAETKPGYDYSPPMEPKQSQSNYTDTFLKILGKYNIKSEDQLTNYAKSRIPNSRSFQNQQIIYLPIPIRYSQRYNSLNHLPVDPLIAVFLSNYGYYLPYSYVIHNNYRNRYGYLASNNIHNNKPFAPYKIFSDTDSSN